MSEELSIKYQELVEWLSSRNMIPKEWAKNMKAVQIKMRELIDAVDVFSDRSLISFVKENREEFSYFHLEKALEMIAKTPEASEKSFFGGYQNQNVKDWVAMQKFFLKDNMHLISLSKLFIQNLSFEVPGLIKSTTMLENQVKYATQKNEDYENIIKQQNQQYINHCEKLGVEGKSLESEILALVAQLPEHFKAIENAANSATVKKALNYYYDFTLYVNSKATLTKIRLPLLDELIDFGDSPILVYENRQSKESDLQNEQSLIDEKYLWYQKFLKKEQEGEGENISWQIEETNIEQGEGESSGISWEIEDTTTESLGAGKSEEAAAVSEINWEIEETGDGNAIQWDIEDETIAENNPEKQRANYTVIETLLSNQSYRNRIISNVSELISFLNFRVTESQNYSSNSILQTYETNVQEGLINKKPEEIEGLLQEMEKLLQLLTNFKFRQLLMIKEQQKSCSRIVSSLKVYKENISRYEQQIRTMKKKQIENEQSIQEQSVVKAEKVKQIQELKDLIEKKFTEVVKRKCSVTGVDLVKLKK